MPAAISSLPLRTSASKSGWRSGVQGVSSAGIVPRKTSLFIEKLRWVFGEGGRAVPAQPGVDAIQAGGALGAVPLCAVAAQCASEPKRVLRLLSPGA